MTKIRNPRIRKRQQHTTTGVLSCQADAARPCLMGSEPLERHVGLRSNCLSLCCAAPELGVLWALAVAEESGATPAEELSFLQKAPLGAGATAPGAAPQWCFGASRR